MPNTLLVVDPDTGRQTALGNPGLTQKVRALDWNEQTGRLYGTSSGDIVEIDLQTGMPMLVASIQQDGIDVWITSLAFAPDGTLYGWSRSKKEIGIIDINAQCFTSVFSTPQDVYYATMDFSPSGTLYTVYAHSGSSFSQTLSTIDLETSTFLNEKSIGLYNVDDIDYAPDGFIYHTNFSHALFRIDPDIGQQINIGFGELGAISGIASTNNHPDKYNSPGKQGGLLAGYTGVGINGKAGVFAKLDKDGATGFAFVNIEEGPATVLLNAYDDDGAIVANETINLSAFEKVLGLPENIFKKDISSATYLKYESDRELVGFQINGSSDGNMLDALPGLFDGTTTLFFPHIAEIGSWDTEICIVNTGDQTVSGELKSYENSGQEINTTSIVLAPNARKEINVGDELSDPEIIGYAVFESDSQDICGYLKFFIEGKYRVAIPAASKVNSGDIYIFHIASDNNWTTGISVLNTTSMSKELTIEFDNGATKEVSIAANEHLAFSIRELFNGNPQPDIGSAVIKNGKGIVGLEIFGTTNASGLDYLSGILLKGDTTTKIYYPHITIDSVWQTGIVSYNPSDSSCNLTITPFKSDGTSLPTQMISLDGKEKYIGTADGLNFPGETAWIQIESTSPVTGFELFALHPFDIDDDKDGYTENEGDCDDGDASIHPGATEICGDGIDQDCDGEDLICPENVDDDMDGFTETQGDCDDGNASIHPGATDICGDGIDQDCDGSDQVCQEDMDDDMDGYTENEGDCDDGNASIHPGATDICGDGIDQDCDGSDRMCPEDIDNDKDGYTENQGDCDDGNESIHPGATDICGDGIDQDCDGKDLTCYPCADISGYWNAQQTLNITCCMFGECESDEISGSGRINIVQNACNFSYILTVSGFGSFERQGTIDGNKVNMSGIAAVLQPGCTATKNLVTLNGIVNGDVINFQGPVEIKGSCDGVSFSCTGDARATLSR